MEKMKKELKNILVGTLEECLNEAIQTVVQGLKIPEEKVNKVSPSRHGACWEDYEVAILRTAFNTFIYDAAKAHQRTPRAIKLKLRDILNTEFKYKGD
jgi:hypothetical protein